jgi:hypothetical protein
MRLLPQSLTNKLSPELRTAIWKAKLGLLPIPSEGANRRSDMQAWCAFARQEQTHRGLSVSRVIEVGSYAGESAQIMLDWFPDALIVCVDSWGIGKPCCDTQAGWNYPIPLNGVVKQFAKIQKRAGGSIISLQAESIIASSLVIDRWADLIYVDACHEYDCVKADMLAWLPKLKFDGIIGGHDYDADCLGVVRAVDEMLGKPSIVFNDGSWLVFNK